MRMCVQYAVDYPDRCEPVGAELDLFEVAKLTFAPVDTEAFPLISLASDAYADGGAMCAVMNAADEVAAGAFLDGRIGFLDISDTVIETYAKMRHARCESTLEGIIAADREARSFAEEIIRRK